MGFGGISSWQLLILLLIIVLIFGTKRLRNIGGDLGEAVKGFKQGMDAPEKADTVDPEQLSSEGQETRSSEQNPTTAEKS